MPSSPDELDAAIHTHLVTFTIQHGGGATLLRNLVTFACDRQLVGQPADLVVLHAIVRTLYAQWYTTEGLREESRRVWSHEAGVYGTPSSVRWTQECHLHQAVQFTLRAFHGPFWYRCLRHLAHWCTFGYYPEPRTALWYRLNSTALRDTWGEMPAKV